MWIFWTIILIIAAVVLFVYSCTGDGLQGAAGILFVLCYVIAEVIITENTEEPKPTALDVYRGNTELEITSVNGVPTDTVVVFKNK